MNPHEVVNEALLSAYLDGEATTAESAQVEQLLRDSDLYQQAFEEMKLLRMGMQQLPKHQLEEGFARSVLEIAGRQQPLPEPERVDLHGDRQTLESGSSRSWIAEHWQGLVLTLSTAAALLLAVRLMLPEQAEDLVKGNNPATDNPIGISEPDQQKGTELADGKNTGQDSDIGSETNNPVKQEDQEKLAGNGGAENEPTTDPAPKNTNPPVNNPVVSNPSPAVPGIEQLADTRLLFVVEVAMTPEGVQNRRLDQILLKHGIIFDRAIEVDRPLEQSILKSRYLKGVVAKRDNKADDYMNVDLIYVVCSGQQVDDTTELLSDYPKEITGHRFNLALLPNELQAFKSLHDAVAAQWKQADPSSQKASEMKARAGRLLADLVLLSGVARPLGTTSLLKVEPVPLPEKPISPPPANKIKPFPLQTMQCEVLFVVRHLSAEELQK